MPLYRRPRVIVQDEGVEQGRVSTLNFVGSGVALAVSGDIGTATAVGGGGSTTVTQVEIDFGNVPVLTKTFTVTDVTVTAASKIIAVQAGTAATGRQADENEMDSVRFACNAGTGSFTVYASSTLLVTGKFKMNYIVG